MMSKRRDPDRASDTRFGKSESATDERVVLLECLDALEQREQPDKEALERGGFVPREASRRANTLLWLIFVAALIGIGALITLVVLTPHVAGVQFATSSRNYHLLAIAVAGGVIAIMVVGLTAAYWIHRSVEYASRVAAENDRDLAESARRGIEKLRAKYR